MVLWSLSTFELLQINWSDTDIGGLDSIPSMWVSHSGPLSVGHWNHPTFRLRLHIARRCILIENELKAGRYLTNFRQVDKITRRQL